MLTSRVNMLKRTAESLVWVAACMRSVCPACVLFTTDPEDSSRLLETTRPLGLIVARGSAIVLISPVDGVQRIENPFIGAEA